MYILNHWSFEDRVGHDGRLHLRLCGRVFGHARFAAGHFIWTSSITHYCFETDSVQTRSGSEYRLGTPDAADPHAKQRLIQLMTAASLEHSNGAATTKQRQHPASAAHTVLG